MTISFLRRSRSAAKGGDGRRLKRVVSEALGFEGVTDRDVSILLTDDQEIHQLNLQWRGKDKPTDVLAFAYDESVEFPGLEHLMPLGDVIISVETAIRQAHSRKVSLDKELELLAVHGTLHLLGYDHEFPEEAKLMRKKTRQIRNKITKVFGA